MVTRLKSNSRTTNEIHYMTFITRHSLRLVTSCTKSNTTPKEFDNEDNDYNEIVIVSPSAAFGGGGDAVKSENAAKDEVPHTTKVEPVSTESERPISDTNLGGGKLENLDPGGGDDNNQLTSEKTEQHTTKVEIPSESELPVVLFDETKTPPETVEHAPVPENIDKTEDGNENPVPEAPSAPKTVNDTISEPGEPVDEFHLGNPNLDKSLSDSELSIKPRRKSLIDKTIDNSIFDVPKISSTPLGKKKRRGRPRQNLNKFTGPQITVADPETSPVRRSGRTTKEVKRFGNPIDFTRKKT